MPATRRRAVGVNGEAMHQITLRISYKYMRLLSFTVDIVPLIADLSAIDHAATRPGATDFAHVQTTVRHIRINSRPRAGDACACHRRGERDAPGQGPRLRDLWRGGGRRLERPDAPATSPDPGRERFFYAPRARGDHIGYLAPVLPSQARPRGGDASWARDPDLGWKTRSRGRLGGQRRAVQAPETDGRARKAGMPGPALQTPATYRGLFSLSRIART